MKQLSSDTTGFHKKVAPAIWFGVLALFGLFAIFGDRPQPFALVVLAFMAVLGLFTLKKVAWDLVDEVWDQGDALVVRKGGRECLIPLTNVMTISAPRMMNPPRITLRLVDPCPFGNEVSFFPKQQSGLNPFAKNEIAEDLIVRVDRARRG